ncbi:MAG: alpha-galactosidase [Leptospiraceae bacterium]|nr:alpha-galactosidase [Leptospiraceae bacterium]
MQFPEDARTHLYYRLTPDGDVRKLEFNGRTVQDALEAEGFEIRFDKRDAELRPMLRRVRSPDVILDRLELVLNSASLASITLHPDVPITYGYRIFQHGYQSWSLSARRIHREPNVFARLQWKKNMDENPETPHQGRLPISFLHMLPAPGRFYSEGLVGLEALAEAPAETLTKTEPVRFLYSISGPGHQFMRFRVHLDPRNGRLTEFAIVWDFNGRLFPNHARESLTRVRWSAHNLPGQEKSARKARRQSFALQLDMHMKSVARNFKRHGDVKRDGIIGWCSWYYYYTNISEEIILKNLATLAKSDLKIDVFQIDDGYQKHLGDWLETNAKFPGGMHMLAERIRDAKMQPGIWLAPFIVQTDSDLYKNNPEMILRQNGSDKPVRALFNPNWNGWSYALDVTHPRYQQWLQETIHTIVHDWGYPYLKLDFLFTAAFRGAYSRYQNRTGAQRLQETLQLIRKAAGKKTFLLGCGCPLWPGVGVFDAMRIGMDVNHIWRSDFTKWVLRDRNYPTARNALINTITRSFMHNRFWTNDPDCLMVRSTRTKLNIKHTYILASVMALSGGMLLLSDDLTELDADRFDLFKKAVALNRKCAAHTPVPLGLLEHEFPRGLYNPAGYIGVWNPAPAPDRIRLELPPGFEKYDLRGATDYWTGQAIPWRVDDEGFSISLAPFESMVAVLDR